MDMMEILNACICEGCPSYVVCKKKEKAFCQSSVGKSKCINMEKGCICGACAVKRTLKLKNYYFCTKGSEKQQNK
jgi:hypothetical protein